MNMLGTPSPTAMEADLAISQVAPKTTTAVVKTAVILFVGLSLCYMALAPCAVEGRGYVSEEMDSGLRVLGIFNAWVKNRPVLPMIWARHGLLPVLLDLPFLKLGKTFASPSFMLSLEPILLTAATLMLLFLWLRQISSPGMSLFLTLTGAFGTLLWPYAYIGLETKQSFFVLLAGYLALGSGKMTSWTRIVILALACGVAMTVKSTGIILAPAIAFLLYVQFRDGGRKSFPKLAAIVVILGGFWLLRSMTLAQYYGPNYSAYETIKSWLIQSPLLLIINAIGLFGSPMKGFFVFVPILLAALYAVPQAFRKQRDTVIFALLITVCSTGFLILLTFPSDEVWGPRYMHLTICPLLLCIGAAWPQYHWRRHWALPVLAAAGLVVSFLGAFSYYGQRGNAAAVAQQNTMEWISGDMVWNELVFSGRLFHVWLQHGSTPAPWTPAHMWVWEPPPNFTSWKTLDLRDFCRPQSLLLGSWNETLDGWVKVVFRICFCSLILGPLLQIWVIIRTVKDR